MVIARSSYTTAAGVPGFLHNCYHSAPSRQAANEGFRGSSQDYSVVYLTNTAATNGSTTDNLTNSQLYYAACKVPDLFHESKYNYPDNITSGMIRTDNPYEINTACSLSNYIINMGADE